MSDLRDLYQEVILDHGKNPRNFTHPEDANRTAHGHNAMCGDTIDVFLKVDSDQAYAVGKAAVELAVKGVNAVMPTIVRKSSKPYRWVIGSVPLAEVANKEKKLPQEYLREDGFGISEACRRYLEPLVAGEAYPPYRNGLPDYVHIRGVSVKKKLSEEFKL